MLKRILSLLLSICLVYSLSAKMNYFVCDVNIEKAEGCQKPENPVTHIYQWQKYSRQDCNSPICNSAENKQVAHDWLRDHLKGCNEVVYHIQCGNPQLRDEDWIKANDPNARSEGRIRGD